MFNINSAVSVAAVTCLAAMGLAAPSALADPSPSRASNSTLAATKRHAPDPSAHKAATRRSSQAERAVGLARIGGKDRYATAVEISKNHFPEATWPRGEPVDVVTVASGTNYPDALAGGPYAAGFGPLLLVPATGSLPATVKAEIQRLSPQAIAILGGTGAVGAGVETQLQALGNTMRFEGSNRYATAAQVALATGESLGGVDTVVLASGEGFADSLAGGASAAAQGGALLLTRGSTLSPETQSALSLLAPTKVQVLGGTGVVSNGVISAVEATLPSANVTRVFGADRAATTTALSEVTFPDEIEKTMLANGWNYPDALAAAPLSWFWGTSVLLSRTTCAPPATVAEDARLAPSYRTAIGGSGSVSDAALNLNKCA